MDTIFMNSEQSKISDPHRLLLNLLNKINLKRSDKYIALSNLVYMEKNKKVIYIISAPMWNDKFELPDGSYSVLICKIILSILSQNMKQ